jgi:hypothetical protein
MRIGKLIAVLLLFAATAVSAQEISDHSIGLRLGDSDGFGAEISYQKSLARYHRLEANFGWRDSRDFDAFKLGGLYQWVHIDFDEDYVVDDDGGLFIFAAGDLGIEYNFDFPLLLSLDFRPELGLFGYGGFSNNFDFDIALGIRYQF